MRYRNIYNQTWVTIQKYNNVTVTLLLLSFFPQPENAIESFHSRAE